MLKTFGEHTDEMSFFFAQGSNYDCGVIIQLKSVLDFNPRTISYDDEGRSIITEAEVQGLLFLIVNIYAPNKVQDQCRFWISYTNILKTVLLMRRIILRGDFNVALNFDLYCSSGRPFRKDSVKHIQDLFLILFWLTFGVHEFRILNALRGVKEIISFKQELTIG